MPPKMNPGTAERLDRSRACEPYREAGFETCAVATQRGLSDDRPFQD